MRPINSAWQKRSSLVKIGQLAVQPELGKVECIIGAGQDMLRPARVGAQIDASLESVLLNGKNALAALMQLVHGALAFNKGLVAPRDDLRRQIEAFSVTSAEIPGGVGIDNRHIGLGIVVLDRRSQINT